MRVMVVLVAVAACDAGVKTNDRAREVKPPPPARPVGASAGYPPEQRDEVRAGILDITVTTTLDPSPRIARDLEKQAIASQLEVCGRKWLRPPRGGIAARFSVDGQGTVYGLETGTGFSEHCFRPKLEHMKFSPGEATLVTLTAMYQPERQDDYLANRRLGRMDLNIFSMGLTTAEVVKRLAPARAELEQCIAAKDLPLLNVSFVIGETPDELEFSQPHVEQVKEPCAEAAIRKLNLTVPGGADVEISMTFGPR
ncbi:MAG: hypothetical protein ABJE66_27355 [Deltaproteobacteria bacterium]